MDFQFDATADVHRLKLLNVIDEHSGCVWRFVSAGAAGQECCGGAGGAPQPLSGIDVQPLGQWRQLTALCSRIYLVVKKDFIFWI